MNNGVGAQYGTFKIGEVDEELQLPPGNVSLRQLKPKPAVTLNAAGKVTKGSDGDPFLGGLENTQGNQATVQIMGVVWMKCSPPLPKIESKVVVDGQGGVRQAKDGENGRGCVLHTCEYNQTCEILMPA